MTDEIKTTVEPWTVWPEDLRGGRYWCVRVPGISETIDIHDDDGGEVLARRIASIPVMEARISEHEAAWQYAIDNEKMDH